MKLHDEGSKEKNDAIRVKKWVILCCFPRVPETCYRMSQFASVSVTMTVFASIIVIMVVVNCHDRRHSHYCRRRHHHHDYYDHNHHNYPSASSLIIRCIFGNHFSDLVSYKKTPKKHLPFATFLTQRGFHHIHPCLADLR